MHDEHKRRQESLLATAFQGRAPAAANLPAEDCAMLMSAVMDGLWLEFCPSPDAIAAERAVDLCCKALDRILGEPESRN